MPSLRRTSSSPAVRPSPYSSAPLAARGNGHRRSSGSDTTTRRVLADIEWWRVTEGQCDPTSDQETEDRNRGTQDSVTDGFLRLGIPLTHVEAGIDRPVSFPRVTADRAGSNEVPSTFTTCSRCSSSIAFFLCPSIVQISLFEPPIEQFSTLAITPHTPTRRHYAPESSSSSLESTPEAADTPLNFDLDEVALADAFLPPLYIQRRSRFSAVLPVMKRSFTFGDYLSLKDDHTSHYADFATSPLSSAPDFLN